MVYEVDKNNRVKLIDSQTHEEWYTDEYINETEEEKRNKKKKVHFSYNDGKSHTKEDIGDILNHANYISYTRTDNLEFNERILDVIEKPNS